MDTVTRRRFLIASGVTGGVALATGSGLVTWRELSQRAVSDPQPVGSKILVLVTLYGGNDGINTLVPYADPAYHDARPELAYAEGEVLHLDASVGLNPAMKGMATLWRAGQLLWCVGSAIQDPTTATSARWTSGRPRLPTLRSTRGGSAGGWTQPATTQCAR